MPKPYTGSRHGRVQAAEHGRACLANTDIHIRQTMHPIRHTLAQVALLLALLPACAGLAAQQLAAQQLVAQPGDADWSPRSGDAWVDHWLGDMNLYGQRYPDSFIDELVRYHAAPRTLLNELLNDRQWPPGDVYMACASARILGMTCRQLVAERERAPQAGWEALLQTLGMAADSAAFLRLKQGIVPSYQRWSRPIDVAFPAPEADADD